MEGLFAAELLVRALSDRLTGKLTLKNGPPSYDAATGTLTVPAWPTEDFEPDELRRLRAFISHESARFGQQTWNEQSQPWKGKAGFLGLMTGLTAPVYDTELAEDFPGAGMNITATLKEEAKEIEEINKTDPFEPSVAMLGTLLRLEKSGLRTFDELEQEFPQFNRLLKYARQVCTIDAMNETEAIEQAKALHKLINDPDPEQESQEEGEGQGEGQGCTSCDGSGCDECEGKGKANDPNSGQEKGKGKPWKDSAKTDYQMDKSMLDKALQGGGAWPDTTGDGTYTFSREHDTFEDLVSKQTTDNHKFRMKPELRRNAQVLSTVLRRALQTEAMTTQRRQIRGSLDTSRLVQLVTGRSAAVMKRKRIQPGINVAVSVSIDASGSMISRWNLTRETVHVLNMALSTLDVPVEVMTWTTGGGGWYGRGSYSYDAGLYRQEPLRLELVKGFNHNGASPQVTRAIETMACHGMTPTGEGLHVAAERLANRPEARKILFLVTDGCPGFYHNGPTEVHERFIADTIARSARSGIEVIGIGIAHKVDRYFPRNVYIKDPSALGPIFQQEIMRVLLQARRKHAATLV